MSIIQKWYKIIIIKSLISVLYISVNIRRIAKMIKQFKNVNFMFAMLLYFNDTANSILKNLIWQIFSYFFFILNICIRYQLPRSHCLQCHKFEYFDYFLTFLWWLLFLVHTLSSFICLGHMFGDLSHLLVNIDMSRKI